MRLAFITHTPLLYGANRSLLALLDEFSRRGHTCAVVGPEGPMAEECRNRGLVFIAFQPVWWAADAHTRRDPLWRLRSVRWTAAALVGKGPLIGQLRAFAPDWIYSNSAATPSGWFLARRLRCRHLWHLREFLDLDFDLQPHWGWPAFRRMVRRSGHTISVSRAVREHLIGAHHGPEHAVVYEGVGTAESLQRSADLGRAHPPGVHGGAWRFVIVGMLQENKGQALALRALAQLQSRGIAGELAVVGGGPDATLRRLAGELGVSARVRFTGNLADPSREYLAADTSLMCSRAEAFGRTTVEAMVAARPVIGRKAGATPELVRPGHNGWLFDGTAESLAAAMAEAASAPGLAGTLGRQAADEAVACYTNERYADGVLHHLAGSP